MEKKSVKLVPSLLSADFAHLADQVAEAEQAGADALHVDVMDGHFVPNLAMGVHVVQSLRRVTSLPLQVHLMISNPDFFLRDFAEAGAEAVLVHWEGNNDLSRTVQGIKVLGKRAGVVINPATPVSVLEEILLEVDLVLVMTVHPGFGHQRFLPSTLPKIERLHQMINRINPDCDLEVDGGIDATTAPQVVHAGANVLVAGSAIFNDTESVAAATKRLLASISRGADKNASSLR
jgi:ribulose-phosphate 3-epimerase